MQAGDFYLCSHAKHGDANYNNKEDCDWIIEAPAGKEPFFKKAIGGNSASFKTFALLRICNPQITYMSSRQKRSLVILNFRNGG